MLKYIYIFLIIIAIVILQLAVFPSWGYNFNLLINLPLLFIVFLAFFYHYEISLISALIMGLLLDLYSPLFFGFLTILLIIEVFAVKFFVIHVLQNKKLSVFLLINLLAILIWQLIYIATVIISARFNNYELNELITYNYIIYLFLEMIIHPAIILVVYRSSSKFKHKLTPSIVA